MRNPERAGRDWLKHIAKDERLAALVIDRVAAILIAACVAALALFSPTLLRLFEH